jgi:hypothetical protein
LAEKFDVKLDEKPGDTKDAKENNVTIRGNKDEVESNVSSNPNPNLNRESAQKRGPAIISGKYEGASGSGNDSSMAYVPSGPSSIQKRGPGSTTGIMGQGSNDSAAEGPTSIMQNDGTTNASGIQAGHGAGHAKSEMQAGHGSADALSAAQNSNRPKGKSLKDALNGAASNPQENSAAKNAVEANDDIGSVTQMGKDFANRGQSATNGKRKKLKALTASEADQEAAGNMLYGENLDPDVPQPESRVSADLVGMLKKSIFENGGEDKSPQSVLEKAAVEALKQVCRPNPDIRPVALTQTAKIGVFPIDSVVLPGYLVLAVGSAVAEDEKRFLKNCDIALRSSFDAMGVAGKLEGGFWLDVPLVEFDLWSQNAGSFNFRLPHLGHEIGVSYFQTEKPIANAKPSSEKDMHTIALADISTDEPVTFKTYLHLKQNGKFYLYLRNGRRLQPEQKQRLEANEVNVVFMKSIDVENYRMFLALVYLKDNIRMTASDDAA